MVNLFTYGSLMCGDIMYKVAGCQVGFSQAVVNNFFRSKMQGREYPGIAEQAKAQVSGVLYYNLTPEALQRLDAFAPSPHKSPNVRVAK
ncbi:gamma-glutamylcyclotransferase family protein [Desulfocastanea catecholica]